jgi:hypothetical protein
LYRTVGQSFVPDAARVKAFVIGTSSAGRVCHTDETSGAIDRNAATTSFWVYRSGAVPPT